MKKLLFLALSASLSLAALSACQNNNSSDSSNSSKSSNSTVQTTEETQSSDTKQSVGNAIGTVSNSLAVDEEALIANNASKFEQKTYTDESTGLSITYNIYLPKNYDKSKSYPTVVFIADSSTVGDDASTSITQGRGANVWVSDEWQAANPSIVVVPTYPETILDDHGSYTTTDYVEMTKNFIENLSNDYAVDTSRIYGTGQSMGAMTTMILAATYPDLYAATMIVDGQWDINTLSGLKDQTFVYFAAEDDENAWAGSQEVMNMLKTGSVSYEYAQWDGTWSPDNLSSAAQKLFSNDSKHNFISWKTGTVTADSNMMGGAAYHMASFDYAYNSIAVMEWLFQQQK